MIGNQLLQGDCLEVMRGLPDNSVDAVVTDPPYGLSFMGAKWDYDVPRVEVWRQCLRVLKPGGHLLSFAGTRTQHRMAVNIEDAGFEIRDVVTYLYDTNTAAQALIESLNPEQLKLLDATFGRDGMLGWVYGSGFPKSMDISKAIDKAAGAEREVVGFDPTCRLAMNQNMNDDGWQRIGQQGAAITAPATPEAQQWEGWGTALKPAIEPITMARKPFPSTVAANVQEWGTGGINVDGCRVEMKPGDQKGEFGPRTVGLGVNNTNGIYGGGFARQDADESKGRWPANLIHDGSDEVVAGFPETNNGGQNATTLTAGTSMFGVGANKGKGATSFAGDSGSAARFFYTAKASKSDRNEGLEGFEDGIYTLKNDCPEHIKKEIEALLNPSH